MIKKSAVGVAAALFSIQVSFAEAEQETRVSRDDFRIIREVGRHTEFDSPGWIEFSRMSVEEQLSVVLGALQHAEVPSAGNARLHREMASERRHLRQQLSEANREIDRLRTDYNRLRAWPEERQTLDRSQFIEYFDRLIENEDFLELLYTFYSNEIDIDVLLSATAINCILDNIGDPRTDYAVSVMIAACSSEAISDEARLTYVETLQNDLEDAEDRWQRSEDDSFNLRQRLEITVETIDNLQSQIAERDSEIQNLFQEIERLHQLHLADQPPLED